MPETTDGSVKAWLDGDPFDLRNLAALFAEGDVRVLHDEAEDRFYLTAPDIDNPPEPHRYNRPAEVLIKRLNGLARMHRADFQPVRLSGSYTTPTGTRAFATVTIDVAPRMSAYGVARGADGKLIPQPPSPWTNRLALAGVNPDVSQVLNILAHKDDFGWSELYKVHEIICHAVEPRTITDYGWTDKATDSAFRASANRADVSGDAARHARNRGTPPSRTMTLVEGRAYIGNLALKWVDHLVQA
ncbi:hypothetical protein [Mycolicibacter arupensis]|uniref:hypothetical protein n=1 Tax=Mycolicibacter arupensis TaxID=342002 RepID=UPI00122D3978|nr:hypothetical protein [Mycolicibacter arupensis]KAA1430087.1 hypothetical protein F0402_15860 [Mycolicibacter arupensis]